MVLLQLRRTHGPANFFRFIDKKPDAIALFRSWARVEAVELLRDFNYQDDRRTDSACLVLEEGRLLGDKQERMGKIKEAAAFLGDDRDRVFEAKVRSRRVLATWLTMTRADDRRPA
jgi:hypothetical protein